jgi:micrococcal nuclease
LSKISFVSSAQTRISPGWAVQSLTLLLMLVLGTGCGQNVGEAPSSAVYRKETVVLPTGAPPAKPTPVSTRVIPATVFTPGPTPTITPIPDEIRGLVAEVLDGETIVVILEGDPPARTYQVRYLGIDAPPNTASVPWGVVAFEANHRLVSGKVVRLERDQNDTDVDGRLLRYVYWGDDMLSIILAEQGLARAAIEEPDTRFQAEILEAEEQARANNLGLWGPPPTATPRVSLTGTVVITTTASITTTTPEEPEATDTVEPEATEEELPTGSPSPAPEEPIATATGANPETPEVVETPASTGALEPTVESTPGDAN